MSDQCRSGWVAGKPEVSFNWSFKSILECFVIICSTAEKLTVEKMKKFAVKFNWKNRQNLFLVKSGEDFTRWRFLRVKSIDR